MINKANEAKICTPVLEQVLNPNRHQNPPVPSRKDPTIVQFLKRIDKFLQRTYIPKRQKLRNALEIPAYKPMLLAKDHHSRRLLQSSPGFESFRKEGNLLLVNTFKKLSLFSTGWQLPNQRHLFSLHLFLSCTLFCPFSLTHESKVWSGFPLFSIKPSPSSSHLSAVAITALGK